MLTILWRCDDTPLSFRTCLGGLGNEPSTVFVENSPHAYSAKGFAIGIRAGSKDPVMLARSDMTGIHGKAAVTAGPEAIPAARGSILPIGGLLLLIGP